MFELFTQSIKFCESLHSDSTIFVIVRSDVLTYLLILHILYYYLYSELLNI